MTVWRLRQGADRRIRAGHPWIFSNELQQSPKGHSPGEVVKLLDHRGDFVATGYGNPHSLIAFRALDFTSELSGAELVAWIQERLRASWRQRTKIGYDKSFRWIYGENDHLPGLVVDRYLLEGGQKQVFAVQVLTAGMEKILGPNLESVVSFFAEAYAGFSESSGEDTSGWVSWENTALVLRNDVQIRKLEGLEVLKPQLWVSDKGNWSKDATKTSDVMVSQALEALQKSVILLNSAAGDSEPVRMSCDLVYGQKTGFFLDQFHNISLVTQFLSRVQWSQGVSPSQLKSQPKQKIRILDLCCYVGHWSTQISKLLVSQGFEVETTLGDVSESALQFAVQNVERAGAEAQALKCDVLEDLVKLTGGQFDIVIADPPAFIKAKKDIPIGKHAYLKLNTQAFRLVKPGGFLVSSSCSGLYIESEMQDTLRKAMHRNKISAPCVLRGGHGPDHPSQMQFSEGFYLKMFLHQIPESIVREPRL